MLLLLTAPAVLAADPPTLGGRISPTSLVFERDRSVNVTNLSTVPVVVTLQADGIGWTFQDDHLSLRPGERATVPLATAGDAETVLRAVLSPVLPDQGMDTASLVLETKARHLTPWERIPAVVWWVMALSSLGIVLILGRAYRTSRASG
jgi:hypothetical protein